MHKGVQGHFMRRHLINRISATKEFLWKFNSDYASGQSRVEWEQVTAWLKACPARIRKPHNSVQSPVFWIGRG